MAEGARGKIGTRLQSQKANRMVQANREFPTLTTERLRLRAPRVGDAKVFGAMLSIPEVTGYATQRLAALATERGDLVMPLRLSDWFWNRGQAPRYKARPRPRVRTVYY
jgi:hypothetical protein